MLLPKRASLSVLLTVAISLGLNLRAKPKEIPLTQIPLLGDYVMNKEVAPYLGDAAEFAIRLLQWSDTNRPSVLKVQKTIKGETYAQEWGANLDYHPLPLDGVIKLTGDTYWALESPRLVKVEISDQIVVLQAPEQLDLLHSQAIPVPFVFRNSRDRKVQVNVRSSGSGLSIEADPRSLKPGQTLGWFVPLSLKEWKEGQVGLKIEAGSLSRELSLATRAWKSGTLKVRILDEHGLPTQARVYLMGADGKSYTPEGVQPRITNGDYRQPYGGEYYFYADGSFEVGVPAGATALEVVKGLEYQPIAKQIDLPPDGEREIEIRLERTWDMAARGWWSGDTHLHANLFHDPITGGDSRVKPKDVLFTIKAEDLNVGHILACNSEDGYVYGRNEFEGKPNALSEERYILYWNEEMRNLRLYGHMAFLELKSFVEPAFVGWPGTTHPQDDPPNYDQAVKAKKQGAAVIYVHPGLPTEYPVDIALGVADTIDVMCQGDEEKNTSDWYQLLNCGFRCPISAGTDSYLDLPYHLIPGAGRVYVEAGPKLTYSGWIEAYKQGKSFATNAPMLTFNVNGKGPGGDLKWDKGVLKVKVEAEATSHVPMDSIELVVNGLTVATQKAKKNQKEVRLSKSFEISDSCWMAIRVRGVAHRLLPNDTALYAHTSPVYFTFKNRPIRNRGAAQFFVNQIEKLIERVHKRGQFSQESEKQRVIELFRKGQNVYREMVEGPETENLPVRFGYYSR